MRYTKDVVIKAAREMGPENFPGPDGTHIVVEPGIKVFEDKYDLLQLPEWQRHNPETSPEPDELPRWSGLGKPPALGTLVSVVINSMGEGRVTGYFVEHGFLGVYVMLYNPPEWWAKQNRHDKRAMAFGLEIRF